MIGFRQFARSSRQPRRVDFASRVNAIVDRIIITDITMATANSSTKHGKSLLKVVGSRPQQLLVLLVSITALVWLAGPGNLHYNIQKGLAPLTMGYRPHFPGSLGKAALDKLTKWNDELFMSTMTMYKLKAQNLCMNDKEGCEAATNNRRPPEPSAFEMYDLFNPYIDCPDGHALERVGDEEDGGKWLCTNMMRKNDCIVFSLGSNGQYDFERDLLGSTECKIYTFDCTYDGVSQGPRHTYFKKCIGTAAKEASDENFITLANAVKMVGVSKIDLLKIDIEGYEFDEMAYWSIKDPWLPEQVAIEVHHSKVIYSSVVNNTNFSNLLWPAHHLDLSDLALFFGHLGHLGYAIASREDNPHGGCCSEFLLVRVVDWI